MVDHPIVPGSLIALKGDRESLTLRTSIWFSVRFQYERPWTLAQLNSQHGGINVILMVHTPYR
jgi:hypothetical protein